MQTRDTLFTIEEVMLGKCRHLSDIPQTHGFLPVLADRRLECTKYCVGSMPSELWGNKRATRAAFASSVQPFDFLKIYGAVRED